MGINPHVEILERLEIIPAIIQYRIDIRGQYLSGIQNDQIMPTSYSMFVRDNNRLSNRHCLPVFTSMRFDRGNRT